MLGNLLPCWSLHCYQKYFQIVSKFELESISKATVVQNLAIYGVNYHLPMCINSHILFVQFILIQEALDWQRLNVWHFQATLSVKEVDQLLPVPQIGIWGKELFWGQNHIVGIQHPAYRRYERCIWHLGETRMPVWQSTLRNPSPVACCLTFPFSSPPQFHLHSFSKHLNALLLSACNIIDIIQWLWVLECHQKFCNGSPPCSGVQLKTVSNGSAPRYRTYVSSQETRPPILSFTCWTYCSWPAPSFW